MSYYLVKFTGSSLDFKEEIDQLIEGLKKAFSTWKNAKWEDQSARVGSVDMAVEADDVLLMVDKEKILFLCKNIDRISLEQLENLI